MLLYPPDGGYFLWSMATMTYHNRPTSEETNVTLTRGICQFTNFRIKANTDNREKMQHIPATP